MKVMKDHVVYSDGNCGAKCQHATIMYTMNSHAPQNLFSPLLVALLLALAPSAGATTTNFFSSGTWICPAGITSVQVECWGGGGAGGSAQNPSGPSQCGGAGAGGAYARYNFYPVTPGNTYYINVGDGGANISTNNGTTMAGGDSWFNSVNTPSATIIAKGGAGGQSAVGTTSSTQYGTGGTGTTSGSAGSVVYAGGSGGTPASLSFGGSGGGSGGTGSAGITGSTTNGIGASAVTGGGNGGNANATNNVSGNGQSPTIPPGGGGGARASSGTLRAGGSGAAGLVSITYTAGGGCTAATAATPAGSGGGTGGLTVCTGTSITLTETPGAGTAPFNYQWSSNGVPVSAATSSTLLISAPINGDQYACDVTAQCGGADSLSSSATLVVSSQGIPGQPTAATTACNPVMVSWAAVGGASSYNVYRKLSGGAYGTAIANTTGTSYSDSDNTNLLNDSTYVYAVTSVGSCGEGAMSADSSGVSPTSAPAITGSPSGVSKNAGLTATFTVAAVNATSYQWQVNKGGGFVNAVEGIDGTGSTTAGFTTVAATVGMNGYQYRCVVSGSCSPPATSGAAILTVNSVIIYDPDIPPPLRTVNCANQSAFATALANAIPGDLIVLADGTYTFGTLTKTGTVANPIVIEALNNAGAIINSTTTQQILNSSYVILNGLRFTSSSGSQQMFEINDSFYIRVTRCSFDGSGLADLVAVVDNTASSTTASHHNRYDHCRWYGKTNTGEYLKWSQAGTAVAISLYDRIDHNFFDGRLPAANGSESTRMGVGIISLVPSYMVCEYNLYKECDGDAEVVSVKTSCATVRSNTYINCAGTGVSLRQGSNNVVYNNIVLSGSQTGNGGIKITGFYHSVHDNYIEGVTGNQGIGALVLQGGDINSVDSTGGHGVIDTLICSNNVLYNNVYGLEVGCKYTPYMPRNCAIVSNKVQQAVNTCYAITGEGTNNIWTGNTARLTGTATAGSANGVSVAATDVDYAAYRAMAITTNDVGPSAVDSTASPNFSPPGGTYASAQTVTISSTIPGASIRYTTNGSMPTSSSGTVYSTPVTISTNTTLQAIAYASGLADSAVTTGIYTINSNTAAPAFNPPAGTYTSTQSVTISTPTPGASIRYTTNGSTPTSSSGTVYSVPVTISTNTTLKAIAYASGFADSTVTTGSYTINPLVTPVFSGLSSPTITYGTPSVSLSGTLRGTNGVTPVYPGYGETVSATINGYTVSGSVNSTSGRFFIPYYDASLATDAVSGSPYAITYSYAGNGTTLNTATNGSSAVLTVNPAELTVSGITASNKVYDATPTVALNTDSAILVGNLDGGNVVLSTAAAAGAFTPDGNVGIGKTVQVSGLTVSGSATNNYTLTQPTATADITAAGLTVTGITANSKTYDGTTSASLNTGGAALVGNLDGGNAVLSAAEATGTFTPDGNVGIGKTVQVSGLTVSGSATNNYTLAQPAAIASISAPPAHVSNLTNGVMNINFFGIPGSNYVVLATTNVGGLWQPVSTNMAGSNSSWLFSDPSATNRQEFYRLVTP